MQINYGPYLLKAHALDNKLTVQVFSELGKVAIRDEKNGADDFPNAIHYHIQESTQIPQAKGLKKYTFGEYTFILGINNAGELVLFHSVRLKVGKKVIEGTDTINFSIFKDPVGY